MRWVAPIWLLSPPPINPQFIFMRSGQSAGFQISQVCRGIGEGRARPRRITVLLDGRPAGEAGRDQRGLQAAKIDDTVAQIAEQPGGTGIVETDSLVDGSTPDDRIDVLEMQIRDALTVPAIKCPRIESGIFAVSRVQADAQQLRIDRVEHRLELILEFDESGRMRVH